MSTVFETMELSEISQRLAFIDAERRKDKELITTLMERLEAQTGKLQAQSRQIQELEGLLANTRAELAKFTQVERAMEQLRQELTLLIDSKTEKQEKAFQELSRLRKVEQESLVRQLSEVRKELKPLPRYDEEIHTLQAEVNRLNVPITNLQHQLAELEKRTDDRMQSVVYLEEQRRQDNRRITQVEAEIPELHRKSDELEDRIPLLEQAIQAKNKEIDKAAEVLEEQSRVIEDQRVSEFRLERQVAEWAKLVEELQQETSSMTAQAARLHEQHELVRRALADLDPFRERIERRQDEMAEMQRLAEDRQKRIMEEWQSERSKEWKRFQVDNEERWRENTRRSEQRTARVKALEEFGNMIPPQIDALWDVQEAWAQSFMVGPREWMASWEKIVNDRPPMPETLKMPPSAPSQAPKIRPLPSVQAAKEEEA